MLLVAKSISVKMDLRISTDARHLQHLYTIGDMAQFGVWAIIIILFAEEWYLQATLLKVEDISWVRKKRDDMS